MEGCLFGWLSDRGVGDSVFLWAGLIEVVVTVLREASLRYLEVDGQPGRNGGGPPALLSYLELLQVILRHTFSVVRSALQVEAFQPNAPSIAHSQVDHLWSDRRLAGRLTNTCPENLNKVSRCIM